MVDFNKEKHWETIYKTKALKDVSWYQKVPQTSLDFIDQFATSKNVKIIDVGGGDSFLVDHLIALGYQDITVLDISETAINKDKERLGNLAKNVKWIVEDITSFRPTEIYDIWHDRATFHFLNEQPEINAYLNTIQSSIRPEGALIIGIFSEDGPKKCSGINITQYTEESINVVMNDHFKKVKCIYVDHKTPFDTTQNFVFCGFRKK